MQITEKKNIIWFSLLCWLMLISACGKDINKPNSTENFISNSIVQVDSQLQSNMVLQQNSKFTISGKGTPDEKIRINCSWDKDINYIVNVSDKGSWYKEVQTPSASFDKRIIIVKGKTEVVFSNILIGEVWICSGQSNMLFRVKDVINGDAEVFHANDYPNIRLLNMERKQSDKPLTAFNSRWEVCSKSTIAMFSAVGYFFGLELHKKLNIPIGLINASWGDTTGEVWAERNSVLNSSDNDVKEGALRNDKTPRVTPETPYKIGSVFNAMIYPLKNISIAGAIWYQGESNQNYPYYYPELLKILVQSWRKTWNLTEAKFPFYISQICPYKRKHNFPTFYANPTMRFMQVKASKLIPYCALECNDDIANLNNIHPKNKQDVGLRLAWLALNLTYGKEEYTNKRTPLFENYEISANKVTVNFKHTGKGLKTIDGKPPTMFEIAGEDRIFFSADAVISGKNNVILSNSNISNPIAVRLGWSYVKRTNLVSSENLPVSVFKTYEWTEIKEE